MKIKAAIPYVTVAIALLALLTSVLLFQELRNARAFIAGQQPQSAQNGKTSTDSYLISAVKNRILKGYGELNGCYNQFLLTKPTRSEGKIIIDWQIETNGTVHNAEIVSGDFDNIAFSRCVVDKISKWQFPEPPAKKYVAHTFQFKQATKKQ